MIIGFWFWGVAPAPVSGRVCVCVLVLRTLLLCTVLKENWLPPNDALLNTLNISA